MASPAPGADSGKTANRPAWSHRADLHRDQLPLSVASAQMHQRTGDPGLGAGGPVRRRGLFRHRRGPAARRGGDLSGQYPEYPDRPLPEAAHARQPARPFRRQHFPARQRLYRRAAAERPRYEQLSLFRRALFGGAQCAENHRRLLLHRAVRLANRRRIAARPDVYKRQPMR